MKNKYKNRKRLIELADRMGLLDSTILTMQEKPTVKEGYSELVNNQRRFVKGILALSPESQERRIKLIEERILMAEASHRAKLEEESKNIVGVE